MTPEDKSFTKYNDIIIVTGLPRSGTSLMMQMLDKTGIELITDGIRSSDEDNPRGYFEFERVKLLPNDSEWLTESGGKAVKVVGELLKSLPDGFRYKILFMMRDIEEIIRSQDKMMERRGESQSDIPIGEMEEILRRYLMMLKRYVNGRKDMEVHYISYNDLLMDPDNEIDEIIKFLGIGADFDKMFSAIDMKLYRNRI